MLNIVIQSLVFMVRTRLQSENCISRTLVENLSQQNVQPNFFCIMVFLDVLYFFLNWNLPFYLLLCYCIKYHVSLQYTLSSLAITNLSEHKLQTLISITGPLPSPINTLADQFLYLVMWETCYRFQRKFSCAIFSGEKYPVKIFARKTSD